MKKMLMGVGSCNSDLLNEPCAFLSDEVARSRPLSKPEMVVTCFLIVDLIIALIS